MHEHGHSKIYSTILKGLISVNIGDLGGLWGLATPKLFAVYFSHVNCSYFIKHMAN